jgi:hypothetical protein
MLRLKNTFSGLDLEIDLIRMVERKNRPTPPYPCKKIPVLD